MKPAALFSEEEIALLTETIRRVEQASSVEIRVHVENHCPVHVLDRAVAVFEKLDMRETDSRNGILIYAALKDRVSAIIGDENVNRYAHREFWLEANREMNGYFVRRRFSEGIRRAIEHVGQELAAHLPCLPDDRNELPDDISFGE